MSADTTNRGTAARNESMAAELAAKLAPLDADERASLIAALTRDVEPIRIYGLADGTVVRGEMAMHLHLDANAASIRFDPSHAAAVVLGEKRTTVRLGVQYLDCPHDLTLDFGSVQIAATFVWRMSIAVGDLTLYDARSDGFNTLAELRAALDRHYPGQITDDTIVTTLEWDLQ